MNDNTAQKIDLDTLPITITYVGEIVSPWDDKHARTVDQWLVKLTSKSGFWTTPYYTGTGLRQARSGQKNPYPPRSISAGQWDRDNLKPVKPTKTDILHSLIMDAAAADENFSDWCANYGYSDDSLKALNTFKQCQEIATALRKHFDRATLEAIREAVADL